MEPKPCPGKLRNGRPCPNVVTKRLPGATHCYPHELNVNMDQSTGYVIMPPWSKSMLLVRHSHFDLLLGLN